MDNSYCLIRVSINQKIVLYYFDNNQKVKNINYPICFTSYSANLIYRLLSIHNCFQLCSISHILYMSQELYKAELCLIFNQNYIQD
uniref:DUF4346 domain-containing protein n=1 Tax=Schimmelmannia schousboei TaxID=173468 RepID=A0A1C9C8Q7_9FLOR|nr:hypothetical protein Schim_071 [Schimmelmannia schousboei]AOM64752.1 hypothetical protein Schim_071 [Schimmelmannia schousboei]